MKKYLPLVLIILFAYPETASAYVDPSVMSYTIQAVAGTLIGLGAVISIIWQIIRRRASRVLKIKENRNAVKECDIYVADEVFTDEEK